MTLAEVKAQVSTLFLQALALSGRVQVVNCQHEVDDIEVARGNLLHCKCGIAMPVPCQHIFVERVLPKVWRCADCHEWRGAGETP